MTKQTTKESHDERRNDIDAPLDLITQQQIESLAMNADRPEDIDEIVGVANAVIPATPAARRWAVTFRNSGDLMTLWLEIQAMERS